MISVKLTFAQVETLWAAINYRLHAMQRMELNSATEYLLYLICKELHAIIKKLNDKQHKPNTGKTLSLTQVQATGFAMLYLNRPIPGNELALVTINEIIDEVKQAQLQDAVMNSRDPLLTNGNNFLLQ